MSEGEVSRLGKIIHVRVSREFFDKMEEKRKKTNCQSVSEFARAILYKEKITFYYTDASLDAAAREIAGVRRELNQIGHNINQITKAMHEADAGTQKMYYALKAAEQYKLVGDKAEKLQIMMEEIWSKWLQRSVREKP